MIYNIYIYIIYIYILIADVSNISQCWHWAPPAALGCHLAGIHDLARNPPGDRCFAIGKA